MAHWWILIFITIELKRATCNYQCEMQSSEVTCSGITSEHLSHEVTATLNKADIASLNLTNGIISTISPSTFKDFNNLLSLYVTNCKVSNLEDNSFSHSLDLTNLYLNKNNLTKFNAGSLPPENGLTILDLSYNLLDDLSDFNVSYFPKLSALNLASNFLSYLPVNLLVKLKEENSFYLVIDNNPWNCNDSNWSEHLTEKLIQVFCSNQSFNYIPVGEIETTTEVSNTTVELSTSDSTKSYVDIGLLEIKDAKNEHKNDNETQLEVLDENSNRTLNRKKFAPCAKDNCATCSFLYCMYWFMGGIWIGIIVGNIPKIKSLLCGKNVTYSDEYTQCEHNIDQYMISGYHLDFNRGKKQSQTRPSVS